MQRTAEANCSVVAVRLNKRTYTFKLKQGCIEKDHGRNFYEAIIQRNYNGGARVLFNN